MDTEAVEFMIFLKRNVGELKRLGSEWGMTTEEINTCIDKALESEIEIPKEQSKKSEAREIWYHFCHAVRFFFKVLLVIFVLIFALGMLVSYHEPTSDFVGRTLQPYGYNIFRLVRLATLPLHKIFNITVYYDSECLVDNPFFEEESHDCEVCQDIKEVKELGSINHVHVQRYLSQQQPFIYKGKKEANFKSVTFEDLVSLYTENKDVLDRSVARFYSTDPEIPDIGSLFALKTNENLKAKTRLSVNWATKNMVSSQVMRKLFPRPPFVSPQSEVALEKLVFVDGPKSQHTEVFGGFYQAVFVQMVKGTRKIGIQSVHHCMSVCTPLHTELSEGDFLVFAPSMWRVHLLPNVEDVSIIYVGSFVV